MIGLHHMGTTTSAYLKLWKTDKFSDVLAGAVVGVHTV